MEKADASFSSLAKFALSNLGEGLSEHAPYYAIISAAGIALALLSPRPPTGAPLQVLFAFFALAFAMRRFDARFRMTPANVAGLIVMWIVIAIIITLAIVLPVLVLERMLGMPGILFFLIVAIWPTVKWSLAAPIYLMPYSPRLSPFDALRESWIIVSGERWWILFALAIVSALFGIFARIVAPRIVYALVPVGEYQVAEGLAAACVYVGAILSTLFAQLFVTAAAAAWTLPANE